MKIFLELELEVDYTFIQGYPAYLSGLPEHCYEEQPDTVELTSVKFQDVEIINALTSEQIEILEAACLKEAQNKLPSDV